MKNLNIENEVSVIKTLCSEYDKAKVALMRKSISLDHFKDGRTRELFTVLTSMAKRDASLPSYELLAQYPVISEEARELIMSTDDVYAVAKKEADAEHLYNVLERFRIARVIENYTQEAMDALTPEDADPMDAVLIMEKGLLKTRRADEDSTLSIGVDSNIMELLPDHLNRTKPNSIPTGFREFDEKAGGLVRSGVTTIAASSGGGKSCMAGQLALNVASNGYKVIVFSLEMQREQLLNRFIANQAEISHTDLNLARLNDSQKRRTTSMLEAFDKKCKESGGKLETRSIGDVSISEIALQVRAFGYDVVIVDYINLLNRADIDERNDAAALGEIARTAKVQATKSNAAWVILAQLSDDGKVKYSRAIKEHSDYMLTWSYGDTEKETHIVEIAQQKSRNSEAFTFKLRENFKNQRFENIGDGSTNRSMPGVAKRKKQKKHPTARPMPGLSAIEEDDDEDF